MEDVDKIVLGIEETEDEQETLSDSDLATLEGE